MTLTPGSRLGTYEILGPLGAGGMGEVYRARDRKLGREVAIKVLPEEFARDASRVARFEREARMLAAVNHPSIAAIYGAEEDGSARYIVMELVEGDTLADLLIGGPLPVAESLRLSVQILEALEVAHEKGVIHRDLKPANIKITPENKVKILDFGLAKAMDLPYAGDISRTPTAVMDQSRAGDILGTPGFMSPEQARGKDTDRRTDIWAFGCLLYEMLTGRRAFRGESLPDVIVAILEREPDWNALPARVPERVRELLRRCLEKDPGHRLRDAADAQMEIESALAGMSGSAAGAAPPIRRRPPWKMVAAILAGAALAAAAYFALRLRASSSAPAGVRQLAVLPFRNLMGTTEGELMGLAMADTVRVRLSNVPGLQVVTPRAAIEASDNDTNFARVARKLGANTLLSGSLQRENERYRITYWLVDASGKQIAANAIDGAEMFPLQDRLADGVMSDLRLRPGTRRTPTPSGLDTASEQERYLQAIGLLQRYDKREGVERAVQILQKLAAEKPNSALVQAALGRASLLMFENTKEPVWADRAVAASNSARALDPELPEVDITLGETLVATGRSRQAIDVFRRSLAAQPDRVEALLGLGRACAKVGDRSAAEAALRQAVALQPSFATENQLGAFYADAGHWDKAADQFRKTVRLWPDSPRALNNLGGVLINACDAAGAMETFRKALAVAPNDPSVASNLGLTQLWTGHFAEAVASLERAVQRSPNDYQVWSNLGDGYRGAAQPERANQAYERSIALAREQLRVDPKDAQALAAVATGLARTGHTAQASLEMQKALALDESDPNLLSDAAIVSALDKRTSDALAWMRKAVAAGYCRSTIARQPEFAQLRENPEFRSIIAAPRAAAGS